VPAFLVPQSRDELRELAELMALAGWAPEGYRDAVGNYLQPRIEMAILHGASVGLGPVAAVQSIAVIDGMPTIWGDGALALIERSGLLEDMSEEYVTDETEGLTAICTMRRRGRPTPVTNRFSLAMAEQARLLEKDGPWQSYPQRMLKMRARSWTIRDGFSDVLRGLHLREEVEDYAGTAVGALSRQGSADRQVSWLHAAPRTRRGSKIGGGVEALWSRRSANGEAAAPPNTEADAALDVALSDDEAVNSGPVCPLDSVTASAESEDVVPIVGSLPEDIAPEVTDAVAADPRSLLTSLDGSAFSDSEVVRTAFDEVGHRELPPGHSTDQRDVANADARAATELSPQPADQRSDVANRQDAAQPLPQPANLKQASAIECERGEQPLVQSPDRQGDALIVKGEGGERVPSRDPPLDPASGEVSPSPPDPCRDLTSVDDVSAPLQAQERPRDATMTGEEAQPEPPTCRGISFGHRWAVRRPKTLPRDRKRSRRPKEVMPNPTLVVTVEPSWGDQRVFQHYRARLRELFDGGAATTALVPRFRETNHAIEARLRQRLPNLISQIDALCAEAARHGR
jgi:hypothetical protein